MRLPIQHGEFEPTSVFDRIKKGDYGWISEDFMVQGYIESVERYPDVWAALFNLLADRRHRPLLFHCTGGKDRTGAAAALILLALGVPSETVVADYGLSDGYNVDVRRSVSTSICGPSAWTSRRWSRISRPPKAACAHCWNMSTPHTAPPSTIW